MRPSTSKTTVELLMALELPESASQDDRLTFKASTMGLWSALSSLASFDILSIDQQYRRVANSLTKIAYVMNKLKLVSTHPRKPVYIHSYGLIMKVFFVDPRFGGRFQSPGYLDILHPPFLRCTPFGSGRWERFKPYGNDERERHPDYDNVHPS